MTYSKPVVLAANNPQGSYAAGCPEKGYGTVHCQKCDRVK